MAHRTAFYYDKRSNLTCVLDPENGLTYYTYDAANGQTSVKNPWDEVTYYEYTPAGRLTKRTLGNEAVSYHEYDAAGRASEVDNRKSDMSVISSFDYVRDANANPVSIVREDGCVVYYEYDAKNQLTSELQRDDQGQDVYAYEWDYDAAGNREYQTFNTVTTYYEYDVANELTEETTGADTTYYYYDHSGNTTAKQEPAGTTYYQYDHENLMTRIDFADDSHNYFAYDADSKRVEKRDSEGYARFIYQGPNMLALLQEQNESEDAVVHYTMGDGLETMRRANGGELETGASSFYHFDALGSTFDLTDINEAVTDTWLYNAWGEILSRTGITINPHTYVGEERYYLNPDPVLYLLGLRYYDLEAGRFTTLDPIGMTDLRLVDPAVEDIELPNLMLYAANNPTALMDPTGLACCPHRLELFFRQWRTDLTQEPYSCTYMIKFRAFLLPQGRPKDCAIVQLLQGFARDKHGWRYHRRCGKLVDIHYNNYVVDSVDVDPRWWSHVGGVRWSGHPAKAWWSDEPGEPRTVRRNMLPVKWQLSFVMGVYEDSKIPKTCADFEKNPPSPLKKVSWSMYFKIYEEKGRIKVDKNPP